jgi:hypothetical protein
MERSAYSAPSGARRLSRIVELEPLDQRVTLAMYAEEWRDGVGVVIVVGPQLRRISFEEHARRQSRELRGLSGQVRLIGKRDRPYGKARTRRSMSAQLPNVGWDELI